MQPTDDCIELEGWYCQLEVGDAFAHLVVRARILLFVTDVTCRDAFILGYRGGAEPEPEPDLPEKRRRPTIGRTIVLGCSDFIDWTSSASIVTINQNLEVQMKMND